MSKGETKLRDDPRTPRPERLNPSDPHFYTIMSAHDSACARAQAGYIDPFTGLFAMTAENHMERGFCCGRGCRHCPFI